MLPPIINKIYEIGAKKYNYQT